MEQRKCLQEIFPLKQFHDVQDSAKEKTDKTGSEGIVQYSEY